MKKLMLVAALAFTAISSTGCRWGSGGGWFNRTFYRGDQCGPACEMEGAPVGQVYGEIPPAVGTQLGAPEVIDAN